MGEDSGEAKVFAKNLGAERCVSPIGIFLCSYHKGIRLDVICHFAFKTSNLLCYLS